MQSVDEADGELRNWARWARDDDPRLGVPEPVYCADYRAGAAWDPGWGDRDAAPDPPLPPIDEPAAIATDRLLRLLARPHLVILRRHYAERRHAPELELGAAIRALIDVHDGLLRVRLTQEVANPWR